MEEKSAGIQRSRRVRYDGGWETVYWLDPQGALGLPRSVLETYGLCPGDSLAVGRICPQSVELVPGRPGEAASAPAGCCGCPWGCGGRQIWCRELPGWRCFHSAGPCFWWTGDWYKKGPPPWAALGAVPFLKQLPAVRIFPAARSQRPLCGFSKTPAAWRRSAGFRRERRSPG